MSDELKATRTSATLFPTLRRIVSMPSMYTKLAVNKTRKREGAVCRDYICHAVAPQYIHPSTKQLSRKCPFRATAAFTVSNAFQNEAKLDESLDLLPHRLDKRRNPIDMKTLISCVVEENDFVFSECGHLHSTRDMFKAIPGTVQSAVSSVVASIQDLHNDKTTWSRVLESPIFLHSMSDEAPIAADILEAFLQVTILKSIPKDVKLIDLNDLLVEADAFGPFEMYPGSNFLIRLSRGSVELVANSRRFLSASRSSCIFIEQLKGLQQSAETALVYLVNTDGSKLPVALGSLPCWSRTSLVALLQLIFSSLGSCFKELPSIRAVHIGNISNISRCTQLALGVEVEHVISPSYVTAESLLMLDSHCCPDEFKTYFTETLIPYLATSWSLEEFQANWNMCLPKLVHLSSYPTGIFFLQDFRARFILGEDSRWWCGALNHLSRGLRLPASFRRRGTCEDPINQFLQGTSHLDRQSFLGLAQSLLFSFRSDYDIVVAGASRRSTDVEVLDYLVNRDTMSVTQVGSLVADKLNTASGGFDEYLASEIAEYFYAVAISSNYDEDSFSLCKCVNFSLTGQCEHIKAALAAKENEPKRRKKRHTNEEHIHLKILDLLVSGQQFTLPNRQLTVPVSRHEALSAIAFDANKQRILDCSHFLETDPRFAVYDSSSLPAKQSLTSSALGIRYMYRSVFLKTFEKPELVVIRVTERNAISLLGTRSVLESDETSLPYELLRPTDTCMLRIVEHSTEAGQLVRLFQPFVASCVG